MLKKYARDMHLIWLRNEYQAQRKKLYVLQTGIVFQIWHHVSMRLVKRHMRGGGVLSVGSEDRTRRMR